MENDFTEEEKKLLKEIAQNLAAGSRLSKILKSMIVYFASIIGGGYVVWEFLLRGKS